MSNLWLNVRFGVHHIQWEYGAWLPTVTKNWVHQEMKDSGDPDWRWFAVYDFFWVSK